MKTSILVKAKYQEKQRQKNLKRIITLERFSESLKVPKKKANRKNTYYFSYQKILRGTDQSLKRLPRLFPKNGL